MRIKLLLAGATYAIVIQGASAQTPNACSAIDDATARLACYDAASHRDATVSKAVYKPVDLLDFKVDKGQLSGSRIEIRGFAHFGGPILTLSVNRQSGVGIYIDPARLPKDDQRRMIAQCTDQFCPVTIRGLVAETPGLFGEVQAESVTFGKR